MVDEEFVVAVVFLVEIIRHLMIKLKSTMIISQKMVILQKFDLKEQLTFPLIKLKKFMEVQV